MSSNDPVLIEKQDYVRALRANASQLATVRRGIFDMEDVYFKREYNAGGANAITDEDIEGLGITAADVANWITMLQQLDNFFENQPVSQGDYEATLSVMRDIP